MRRLISITVIVVPMLANAQSPQYYTNCRSYGNRMDCEHGQRQQPMGRINTVNPNSYMPQAPTPHYQGNPFVNGMRKAQEDELRQQQIEYFRNLNRQMR